MVRGGRAAKEAPQPLLPPPYSAFPPSSHHEKQFPPLKKDRMSKKGLSHSIVSLI